MCAQGSQYFFLPIFPTPCYCKCIYLWEKYTYISFFHPFFIVLRLFFILFIFAVIILESQDKPLFSFSLQRKRWSVLKPAIHLSVYVEKPWCLFLLTDAEVSTRKKTFAEVQTERLDQAERTVLIKCPSKLNEKKLLQYLSSHGDVKSHFFFENRVSN